MLASNWPRRGFRTINYGGRPSGNYGTNVQSGAVAHTLSASYVELEDSLPYDIYWINIIISATCLAATQTDALLSIYIGAGGSEFRIIGNLAAGWSAAAGNGTVTPKTYGFPLYLPAGTRISAKSQSLETSKEVRVGLEYTSHWNRYGWTGAGVEAIGVNTSVSQGTSVTPGTTSDGTWTDIGTTNWTWGYVQPMMHGAFADTSVSAAFYHADIGTASVSYPELEDFLFITSSGETAAGSAQHSGQYCQIPANTPLQLRLQNYTTGVGPLDFMVYGVY